MNAICVEIFDGDDLTLWPQSLFFAHLHTQLKATLEGSGNLSIAQKMLAITANTSWYHKTNHAVAELEIRAAQPLLLFKLF